MILERPWRGGLGLLLATEDHAITHNDASDTTAIVNLKRDLYVSHNDSDQSAPCRPR